MRILYMLFTRPQWTRWTEGKHANVGVTAAHTKDAVKYVNVLNGSVVAVVVVPRCCVCERAGICICVLFWF